MTRFFALVSLLSILCLSAVGQDTAVFGGIVVDEVGNSVPGATVSLYKVATCYPSPIGCVDYNSWQASTDVSGRFAFTQLPAGQYNFCASGPKPAQLGTCSWASYPGLENRTNIALAEGQVVSDVRLILYTGTLVKLHISDPGGWLSRTDDEIVFKPFFWVSGGNISPARRLPNEAGIVYGVALARGYPASLTLFTPLVVLNEAGESVPLSQSPSHPVLTLTTGPDQLDYNFTVVSAIVNAASYWPCLPDDGIGSLFAPGINERAGNSRCSENTAADTTCRNFANGRRYSGAPFCRS